jgi:putative glycosyltransferase (TIGR04372 family)
MFFKSKSKVRILVIQLIDKSNKILSKFIFIILLPLTFLLLLLCLIFKIRFGKIRTERIGHMAFELGMYLNELDNGMHQNNYDIFYYDFQNIVSNKYFLNLLKRRIKIYNSFIIKHIIKLNKTIGFDISVPLLKKHFDELGFNNTNIPPINFNETEVKLAHDLLTLMNFDFNKKYLCLHLRDSSYLETFIPNQDLSYHKYRDVNINNYLLMINKMEQYNTNIIRIGVQSNQSLHNKYSNYFDFINKNRNEFLETFLIKNCKFFICTNSGPCALGTFFRVPNAFVNVTPFLGVYGISRKNDMFLPKKYYSKISNNFLTLDYILKNGIANLAQNHLYNELNIEVVENTESEISDFINEMYLKINNSWILLAEEEELLSRYNKILISNNIRTDKMPIISTTFLLNNKSFLI